MSSTDNMYVYNESFQHIPRFNKQLQTGRLTITKEGHMTITFDDGTVLLEGPIQNYAFRKNMSSGMAQWYVVVQERKVSIDNPYARLLFRSSVTAKWSKEEYRATNERMNRLLSVAKNFGAPTKSGLSYELASWLIGLVVIGLIFYIAYRVAS
jgi:hypothetical protein